MGECDLPRIGEGAQAYLVVQICFSIGGPDQESQNITQNETLHSVNQNLF